MQYGLKFKKVLRYSSSEKKYRLFRIIYNIREMREDFILGKWVSLSFQVALMPKLFMYESGMTTNTDWRLVLLGLSLHLKSMAGGYAC